jgi:hypothetical protein
MKTPLFIKKINTAFRSLPEITRRFFFKWIEWFIIWSIGSWFFFDEEVSVWKNVFKASIIALFSLTPLAFQELRRKWLDKKAGQQNNKQYQ